MKRSNSCGIFYLRYPQLGLPRSVLTQCLRDMANHPGHPGSPASILGIPLASQSQAPQAKDPRRKIPNQSSQAQVTKLKFPSQSS